MSTITIRLEVPVSRDDSGPLVFTRWLPLQDHIFSVQQDRLEIQVWFDIQFLDHIGKIEPEKINNHINLRVGKVGLDIKVKGLSNSLIDFICRESKRPQRPLEDTPTDKEFEMLSEEYSELGQRVMKGAVELVNRIANYFRVMKGQYWVKVRQLDLQNQYSFCNETRAKVKSEKFDWVRWCPPPYDMNLVLSVESESRLLQENEWDRLISFVQGDARPDLSLELLANAEELGGESYNRVALVEAVAALEVALNRFVQSTNESEIMLDDRLNLANLYRIREKLGLRATIDVLLPLLIPGDTLPRDCLDSCRRAIDLRGTVVHHGKRVLSKSDLNDCIPAVRQLCEILIRFTK